MTRVKITIPSQKEQPSIHKRGNIYLDGDGELYILAQFDDSLSMSLINLSNGNRINNGFRCESFTYVSEVEFRKMGGEGLKLVENVEIILK